MAYSKQAQARARRDITDLKKILKKGDITKSEYNAELKRLKQFLK